MASRIEHAEYDAVDMSGMEYGPQVFYVVTPLLAAILSIVVTVVITNRRVGTAHSMSPTAADVSAHIASSSRVLAS